MKQYISAVGWMAFVISSIGLASYGLMEGWAFGTVLFVQGATAYFICILAELIVPYRQDWRWQTDTKVFSDIGHVLIFDQAVQNLFAIGTIVIFTYIRPVANDASAITLNIAPMMIILGVVYLEFSEYWRHRFLHASERFWPLHALHHHLDRMHIFRSGRVHFMDGAARVLFTYIPALLIGLPVEAIIWWMILLNATGPISHSNLNIETAPWLNAVLATPMVHRVHHASDEGFMRHNLSPVCPLVDRLFGTWLSPEDNLVTAVGVTPDLVPTNFFMQLIYPFFSRSSREKSVAQDGVLPN